MNSTSFLLCSDHRLFHLLIIPIFFKMLSLHWPSCAWFVVVPNGREKRWMPYLLNFWSLTLMTIVSLFSLVDFSLAGSITHMYNIIYRMKNHSTCFRSFPLFVWVVFTLTMSIPRDYHRNCISHDTHSSHSPSCRDIGEQKKKPKIGKQHRIEWNGFIFVLRSNVCAYLWI